MKDLSVRREDRMAFESDDYRVSIYMRVDIDVGWGDSQGSWTEKFFKLLSSFVFDTLFN